MTVVGCHATVGRLSNNVFWTFQAIWENFEKSRWTVTRQWLRSRDHRPTVKQRFLDVSGNLREFWKKWMNGHATVVGGHAIIGRLSNNVFSTFQAIKKIFEKSRWTVTRQWSEVTRPSADCQTTFFGRFKQLENFLRKVAERSRDSGRRSRDRRTTVKQRFWTFQAIRKLFVKSHWRVTRQWSVVTRLSADCQAHICMYIIINERERDREREKEKERESEIERERERERETEYYVAFGRRIADEEAKIRQKNLPDNFPVCWLLPHLSRFFTGISRKRYVVLRRLCL